MELKEPEGLITQATLDGLIEIECPECGALMIAEPDACDLFCQACGRVTAKNPLTELGLI